MSQPSQRSSRSWFQWGLIGAIIVAVYFYADSTQRSPLVGKEAPPLNLSIAAGGAAEGPARVRLSALRGQVVVLDFWASWCTACRKTTPILNALHEEFAGDDVSFFAVNVEPIDRERLQLAHATFGTGFPTLHDRAGAVQRDFAIRMLPTILVIGRDGVVDFAVSGMPSESKLRGAIAQALEPASPNL